MSIDPVAQLTVSHREAPRLDLQREHAQPEQSGALVLVVGSSGAGKDTLMDAARMALRHEIAFSFVRRVITRDADAGGEVHDSVSEAEFDAAERAGAFALSWRAHGLGYGIPASILSDIKAGKVVIANVSRAVIPAAEHLADKVVVINVTAPVEVLTARLAARGRESAEAIEARLKREHDVRTQTAELVTIDNDRTIAEATAEFVQVLTDLLGGNMTAHVNLRDAPYRQPDHAQD